VLSGRAHDVIPESGPGERARWAGEADATEPNQPSRPSTERPGPGPEQHCPCLHPL